MNKIITPPIRGFIQIIEEYTSSKKENLVVAEVGTYIGATTMCTAPLVKRKNGSYLAIDWFKGSENTSGLHSSSTLPKGQVLEEFNKNIKNVNCDDIVQIYDMTSLSAANVIPDKSIDICFIDADHRYEAVKADIKAYLPKMKPGGILCGHDFEPPAFSFLDTIRDEELNLDFVPRIIESHNYVYQSFNGKVINQELIRKNPELFYFHPGVIKAVTEMFKYEDLKFYLDNVWAIKII